MPKAGDVVAIGLAVAGLATAITAGVLIGSPSGTTHGSAAADAFLTAWRRQLESTWYTEASFTRESSSAGITETIRTAQRPPDRLRIGLGSIEGRVNGHIIRCATTCVTGAEAPPYDQAVDDELAALASHVQGARPLYSTTDFGDGCFRLTLALDFPSPPYGDEALFCFDGATGAPILTVIERDDLTERTEATTIRAPTDEDFIPEAIGAGNRTLLPRQ